MSGLRLDLACGQTPREGFTGVDLVDGPGVAYLFDLTQRPWPWRDSTVAEVYCSHFVEHLVDLVGFVDEVWRVCEDGAGATIVAPYYTSIRAWQDPTHVRAITEATWLYFDRKWREATRLDHYPIAADFDVENITFHLNPRWADAEAEARDFAVSHYVNVVDDLTVELRARKR